MKQLLPILALLACGNNITYLEVANAQKPTDAALRHNEEVSCFADAPVPEHTGPEQNVYPSSKVPTLCISPSPELDGRVRASVSRFAERLKIPMVVDDESCPEVIPVFTQPEVWFKGDRVAGRAHYEHLCVFEKCNGIAYIVLEEALLHEKVEWLDNDLDHEIGHILSAWGTVAKIPMHLPAGNLMHDVVRRTSVWTQADIDLWCSASPCGKTVLDPDWQTTALPTSAVADVGTSYLSDDGLTPADAGADSGT